jgi:hypothetical protein
MTNIKRKILFYTLVCVFFAAGYLALLFAFGYTYDFEQKKFVETGSIYINANISSLVSIGGSKAKETSLLRSDYSKKYLLPGVYNVEVSKEDYRSWNKKIQIPAGLVASFNNIVLLPNNLEPVTIFPNLSYLSLNKNTDSAFYTDENQQFGFIDYKNSRVTPFTSRLTISPRLTSWDEEHEQFFVSNYVTSKIINDEELDVVVPSTLLNSSLVLRDNYIISQLGQTISIYDHEKRAYADYVQNVSSLYVEKDIIYFINSKDFLLYEYDLRKQEVSLISGVDNFKGGKLTKVSKIGNDYIVSIDNKLQTIVFKVNVEEIKLVAQNVTDYRISYDEKMIAWWDTEGISVYWLKDTKTQPFKKIGETERILILKGINNAYWHKQNGHLIIFTNRLAVFTEIDTRYAPNTITMYDLFKDYDFKSNVRFIEAGIYNGNLNAVFFRIGSDLLRISLEE